MLFKHNAPISYTCYCSFCTAPHHYACFVTVIWAQDCARSPRMLMHVMDLALTGLDTNVHTWSPSDEMQVHKFSKNKKQICYLISTWKLMLALINVNRDLISESVITKWIWILKVIQYHPKQSGEPGDIVGG